MSTITQLGIVVAGLCQGAGWILLFTALVVWANHPPAGWTPWGTRWN